jgi:hypothetical protein
MNTVKSSEKKIYYYWGLTWPTLIIGALVILAVAAGYGWIALVAMQSGN